MSEQQNHEFTQKVIEYFQDLENQYLQVGRLLKVVRDEHKYQPDYANFYEFLEELKISQATASKLINIYEKFIEEYNFPTEVLKAVGKWSTLAEILPLVKDEESAKHWVARAATLRRSDLRMEKRIAEGKADEDCEHLDSYTINICRACGARWKDED